MCYFSGTWKESLRKWDKKLNKAARMNMEKEPALKTFVISEEWKYKGVKYYKGGKDEILGRRLNEKPQWRMGRPITE